MRKDLARLSTQALNGMFAHLANSDNDVLWIRSADDKRQLYVSPSYTTLWGREQSTLYENPNGFMDTLLPNDIHPIAPSMNARFDGITNTVYYRIIHPELGIQYIKDFSLALRDNQEIHFATTGVSQLLTPDQWENQVKALADEKKIASLANLESPFLDLLEKEYQQFTATLPRKKDYSIETDTQTVRLTLRQAECLHFLAKGYLNKVIASVLNIDDRTVQDHIDRVKDKLGCTRRMEILGRIRNIEDILLWKFSR